MRQESNWSSSDWISRFSAPYAPYRELRKEVWLHTLSIVQAGSYTLADGRTVTLPLMETEGYTKMYQTYFDVTAANPPVDPIVTVTAKDCLETAHEWQQEGLEPCVLNMASRRNPGGGVQGGAGAQEEYLFRCSDSYRFFYPYAPFAGQYGLAEKEVHYPLDRNYGGIYAKGITVFRGTEEAGYPLLEEPWHINMIAVAGINHPDLEVINGEERIAAELIPAAKNKIRTIFRIALANGQKNLVLGALGCGAFRNPPRHVAELFREVLCEPAFAHSFSRITFAVKSDHNSHKGRNYEAFRTVLDGFRPDY